MKSYKYDDQKDAQLRFQEMKNQTVHAIETTLALMYNVSNYNCVWSNDYGDQI